MKSYLILTLFCINFVGGPKIDELRASITRQEQRAYIKCSVLLGYPASKVYFDLQKVARREGYSHTRVYELYREFSEGTRLSSENDQYEGKERTATDDIHKEKLKELLLEDKNWSTFELSENLGISTSSTKRLLKEVGAKKIASRWVPHDLTPDQKKLRADICDEHLQRYNADNDVLARIIAIDETWIKSYDPSDPRSSRQWRLPGQSP